MRIRILVKAVLAILAVQMPLMAVAGAGQASSTPHGPNRAPVSSWMSGVRVTSAHLDSTGWSAPTSVDPSGGGLTSISCPSTSFCTAIDGDGYAMSWNGASWSAPTLVASGSSVITSPYSGAAPCDPNSTGFCSVSCPSSDFCVAVGGQSAYSWNGSSWSSPVAIDPDSEQPNQSNGVLSGISCPSATRCVAVDNEGDTMVFNGSTWSGPALPPPDTSGGPQPWFQSVSCPTAGFCVAVGDNYEDTWTLSAGWAVPQQIIVAGQGLDVMSVSCPDTNFCAAVDDNGDTITWDPAAQLANPSSYSGVTSSAVDPTGDGFAGVSCPTASFCVAVDHYGQASTWNGSSWSSPVVIDNHLVDLTSVSCPTTALCMAAGTNGDVVEWSSAATAPAGPTVASLSPSSGSTAGGTEVTVDGSGFVSGGTTVSFGTTTAPQVSVISPDQLTVTAPAAPVGTTTPHRVDVTVTTSAGTSPASVADGFLYVSAGLYEPLAPYRICDTRAGNPSGLAGPDAQCDGETLQANQPLKVQVTGTYGCWTTASCSTGSSSGVPSSGVQAAVLNVTVTNPTASSYMSVYPDGVSRPFASNLNFVPGQTAANLVEVAVGQDGAIDVEVATGTANVIIDVEGYYSDTSASTAGMYYPLSSPQRICDTRAGNPSSLSGPAAQCNGKTLGPRDALSIQVAGVDGIPAPGTVEAVVANITGILPSANTYLSAGPDIYTGNVPDYSNLNLVAGETRPNQSIVMLSPAGTMDVYNFTGDTNVVVDVTGWFSSSSYQSATAGSMFMPSSPQRICDTRAGNPSSLSGPAAQCNGKTLGPSGTLTVQISGVGGVPATNSCGGSGPAIEAVAANLTAVDPTSTTWIEIYPGSSVQPSPPTSVLNPAPASVDHGYENIEPNMVVVGVNVAGAIDLYNFTGTVGAVLDVQGWYVTPCG